MSTNSVANPGTAPPKTPSAAPSLQGGERWQGGGSSPAIIPKTPPTTRQRIRRRLRVRENRAVISAVLFFVVWHVIAIYVVENRVFLTGPVDVARSLRDLWRSGELQTDLRVSSMEFVRGFVGGLLFGVGLGLLLGTSRRVKEYIDPIVNGFNATPLIALAPLFVLWFGIGETKTVVLVFLLVFLPITINTDVGIRATDRQLLEAARSFGAGRMQLYTKVRLPSALPFLVAGIRMGIARGLIGVVAGELFGSSKGLGNRILIGQAMFDSAQLLGMVLIFAATGVTLVSFFNFIERRIAPWRVND